MGHDSICVNRPDGIEHWIDADQVSVRRGLSTDEASMPEARVCEGGVKCL